MRIEKPCTQLGGQRGFKDNSLAKLKHAHPFKITHKYYTVISRESGRATRCATIPDRIYVKIYPTGILRERERFVDNSISVSGISQRCWALILETGKVVELEPYVEVEEVEYHFCTH